MLFLPKALLVTGDITLASLVPPAYQTYHNARFGYPADFKLQPESDKDDGRRFVSADGQMVLAIYASYEDPAGSLAEDRTIARQTWQKRPATLALDQRTRTGYMLLGQVKGRIFQEKTVFKSHTLTTFLWEYPAARKVAMDAVIQHTIQTLQSSVAGAN